MDITDTLQQARKIIFNHGFIIVYFQAVFHFKQLTAAHEHPVLMLLYQDAL